MKNGLTKFEAGNKTRARRRLERPKKGENKGR